MLRHGAAMGVGVHEHGRLAPVGVLGRQTDRERRTPRGARGAVYRDHPPGTELRAPVRRPGRGIRDQLTGPRGADRVVQQVQLVLGHGVHDTEPPQVAGVASHRYTAHVVAQQVHHCVRVQSREGSRYDSDLGLPGRGGGEEPRS